ncbi:hypothetical protein B9Z55_020607 [Caenorhabditis nigoni]|uniref:BTB domain-containing protein n=1 Tax=Caenorhabditis nigoni TaxID=1611254 RepID=A0A2G5TND7_9PELO|nr:hypothetical protein B9Z55_020607 [Caenorhabditis nigoni]
MANKENGMDIGDNVDAQQREIKAMKRIFDEMSEQLQSMEESISKISKSETSANSKQEPTEKSINSKGKMPAESQKCFVLKHVFTNIAGWNNGDYKYAEDEEHFNVKCCIVLARHGNHLNFSIFFYDIEEWSVETEEDWSVQTKIQFKLVSSNGNAVIKTMDYCVEGEGETGFPEFMDWQTVEKKYLVDGNLTAEIQVQVIETVGLGKEKIRTFDESNRDVSDVVLTVRDTKFYVLKKFLAAQSSFFKTLFFGNFSESLISEVTLTGIDPYDFHHFLECLYGESAIDDTTVEGVFLLADMYDAPTVIRRCQEFLLEKSEKALYKKIQIANRNLMQSWTNLANESSEYQKMSGKSFVLKHVFKNVANLRGSAKSEKEDHFGMFWYMCLEWKGDDLEFFIDFSNPISTEKKWSIETEIEVKIIGKRRNDARGPMSHCFKKSGRLSFQQWPYFPCLEELEEGLLVDGNLTVEVHVTIKKSVGLRKGKIRKFDVSQKDVSDVVLDVKGIKFYSSKMYLAAQSSFFKDLFCGTFSDSMKSEVTLTGIDPHDFQNLLELLYSESAINDSTVEGILHLALIYEIPTATKRCEEFLLLKSKKKLKKKLMLAVRYKLKILKVNVEFQAY